MNAKDFLANITCTREQVDKFTADLGPDGLHPNRGWKYDAELGWVHADAVHTDPRYGVNKSITWCSYEAFGARKVINGAGQPARLHTYGNSFTHCDQVSDGETWQEYLAGHLREPVYNFGVGGYSVYQAYRRMVKVHRDTDHHATHVILNVYEDDHFRNIDAWRSIRCVGRTSCGFTLPHIVVDPETGACTEHENMLDTPEQVYQLCDPQFVASQFADRRETQILIEKLEQARQRSDGGETIGPSSDISRPEYAYIREARLASNEAWTEDALTATRHVVEKFEKFTSDNGIKLMVMLSFGKARVLEALTGQPLFDQTFVDWLKTRDLPVVDMRDKFRQRHEQVGGDLDALLDPYWIGHHSPAGNYFTAWALMDKVVDWLDPTPAPYA